MNSSQSEIPVRRGPDTGRGGGATEQHDDSQDSYIASTFPTEDVQRDTKTPGDGRKQENETSCPLNRHVGRRPPSCSECLNMIQQKHELQRGGGLPNGGSEQLPVQVTFEERGNEPDVGALV